MNTQQTLCDRLRDLLPDYVQGNLDETMHRDVEIGLRICPDLDHELQALQEQHKGATAPAHADADEGLRVQVGIAPKKQTNIMAQASAQRTRSDVKIKTNTALTKSVSITSNGATSRPPTQEAFRQRALHAARPDYDDQPVPFYQRIGWRAIAAVLFVLLVGSNLAWAALVVLP